MLFFFGILMMTMLCITERDESSTDTSDHNSTFFAEVDKRVKRRLLMGNNSTPVSWSQWPGVCYFYPRPRSTARNHSGVLLMSRKPMHSSDI